MISEKDDHIPAPAEPKKAAANGAAPKGPRALGGWGDRVLFAALGILLGFVGAYLYLERGGGDKPVSRAAADPHAGLPGFDPGATRDLPGGGGGAPPIGVGRRCRRTRPFASRSPRFRPRSRRTPGTTTSS